MMANTIEYKKFKKQVLINAQWECEICHTSDGLTVHHMLKQSTFPQFKKTNLLLASPKNSWTCQTS